MLFYNEMIKILKWFLIIHKGNQSKYKKAVLNGDLIK